MAEPRVEREPIVERMITLSDALVAIAMTLLVLSIEVPDVSGSDLGSALADLWPNFFAWLLSFVILAVLWYAQHTSLVVLESAGGRVLIVNFVFLAAISVIPFTSQLLGEYGSQGLATAIYAGNIALATLALYVLDWMAELGGHHVESADPMEPIAEIVPTVVFVISIPVALFVSTEIAQYSWISIVVLRPLVGWLEARRS